MQPDFLKAHIRQIIAALFTRDFSRTKIHVERSLEKCPNSTTALQAILTGLQAYNTPDAISNPCSRRTKEVQELVRSGCEVDTCPLCSMLVPHECCWNRASQISLLCHGFKWPCNRRWNQGIFVKVVIKSKWHASFKGNMIKFHVVWPGGHDIERTHLKQ